MKYEPANPVTTFVPVTRWVPWELYAPDEPSGAYILVCACCQEYEHATDLKYNTEEEAQRAADWFNAHPERVFVRQGRPGYEQTLRDHHFRWSDGRERLNYADVACETWHHLRTVFITGEVIGATSEGPL